MSDYPHWREEAGPGPWENEPDWQGWTDAETGLPCFVARNSGGAWCGYVGVPAGMPGDANVQAHGGVNTAFVFREAPPLHYALALPQVRWDETRWFGFDCAHLGDLNPRRARDPSYRGAAYRDLAYVRAECTKLAEQLKEYVDLHERTTRLQVAQ